MADNESFAYQVRSRQVADTVKLAEAMLISLERAQKLDLLIHLIANLRQSLVICGANGIGKSTLLAELNRRKNDVWPILTLKATPNLSFESIQEQIVNFVKQSVENPINQDFSSLLVNLDKQNQKIVILVENAGELVPGLIATLIQYATVSQSIRMVFSLTHDELHIKTRSDQAIEGCHFIEIPPLTEKQCGLFLQQLSRQPNAVISFHAINERMIAKLYQKTHGIPGKIITELPGLSNYSAEHGFKWGAILFLIVMVSAGVGFYMLTDNSVHNTNEGVNKAFMLPSPEVVEISSPVVEKLPSIRVETLSSIEYEQKNELDSATGDFPDTDINNESNEDDLEIIFNKPLLKKQMQNEKIIVAEVKKETGAVTKTKESDELEPVIKPVVEKAKTVKKTVDFSKKNDIKVKKPIVVSKNKKTVEVKKGKRKQKINGNLKDDSQWVLAQAGKQYTIQLMALSNRESAVQFLKKNNSLKDKLKYFGVNKQGKKVFILIYGSFKTPEAASKQMQSLPVKYRKSWVRRFEPLQTSINN